MSIDDPRQSGRSLDRSGEAEARGLVLAAGRGVRMKSDRAKVLHEVLGRPVIHHVLRALRTAGVRDIGVVVGHQEEDVRLAVGEGVRFIRQAEQKGTGHAVLCAQEWLKGFAGDVVVLAGDAPLVGSETIGAMIETHRRQGAACTLLTACLDDPKGYGRIARDPGGRFLKIVEELDASETERRIQEVNSGHYVFQAPSLFEALREIKPDNRKGEYYLTDVTARFAASGKTVATQRAADPAEVYGINTRQDLVSATNFLRWRVLQRHLDQGVAVVDPSTTYIEEDVTIGPDTVIRPFTVIEHDVAIGRRCDVGPFSHLRPGTVLEDEAEIGNFVEVKQSRVGRRSKAKHLSYLGDATLGERVNIGAGTITANFDGVRKHPTVIEDDASTGSNTVLVAPVKLGRGAKTGAGAVVLAERDVPAGGVAVGVPARLTEKRPAAKKAEGKAPAPAYAAEASAASARRKSAGARGRKR